MIFIAKIHQGLQGVVVVVSDKEIVGKKFEEGKLQLDLTGDFYAGEEMDEGQLRTLVKGAYVLHLTGEKTIKLFLEWDFIEGDKILIVEMVPHAEVYLMGG